jgi:uncharacterized cysteine cluster protein YcgN (CxxCxxCC family)
MICAMNWESLCNRCGCCCYEKIELVEGVILYGEPCRYLDTESRLCKIYPERMRINPACIQMTEEIIGRLYWLPPHCGYRKYYESKKLKESKNGKESASKDLRII